MLFFIIDGYFKLIFIILITSDNQEKHHHHHHHLQDSNDGSSTLHSYKTRQRMNISSIVTKDENDKSLIHYQKT
ncbi:unnamed protein product [Rotaria sordida]|uniref:Uncharacterized protein n=1 Tax=Rotaria sordida TaxID=392033 RepID=A0A814UNA3_9BILA|nr:unnamed protein product [Rotaria sordida]